MHVHLDPVGGSAGDMFIAAILDAWPDRAEELIAAVRAAGVPESVSIRVTADRDHALTGTRFQVAEATEGGDRRHVHFHEIRRRLSAAALADGTRQRALAIFTLLAEAESRVHDVPIEEVTFHELGAWDSIADVVGAAFLIDALGPASMPPSNGSRASSLPGPYVAASARMELPSSSTRRPLPRSRPLES